MPECHLMIYVDGQHVESRFQAFSSILRVFGARLVLSPLFVFFFEQIAHTIVCFAKLRPTRYFQSVYLSPPLEVLLPSVRTMQPVLSGCARSELGPCEATCVQITARTAHWVMTSSFVAPFATSKTFYIRKPSTVHQGVPKKPLHRVHKKSLFGLGCSKFD